MAERPILFSGEMVRAILDGRKSQTRRVVKPQPNSGPHGEMVDLGGAWGLRDGDLSGEWRCPYGQPGDRLWVREAWTADFGQTFSDNPGAWWHEMPKSLRTQPAVEMLYYAADDSIYHAPDVEQQVEERAGLFSSDVRRSTWVPRDEDLDGRRWQPSIHMPRWASRITLEITAVRVERVQDISKDSARAEGVDREAFPEDLTASDELLNAECGYFPPTSYIAGFANLWDSLNAKRGFGWDADPYVWVIEFRRVESDRASRVSRPEAEPSAAVKPLPDLRGQQA